MAIPERKVQSDDNPCPCQKWNRKREQGYIVNSMTFGNHVTYTIVAQCLQMEIFAIAQPNRFIRQTSHNLRV